MDYIYLGSSLPKLGTQELTAERDIQNIQDHIYSLLDDSDQVQFAYLLLKNDNKNLLHILRKRGGIPEEAYFSFHKPSFYTYQDLEEGINGDKPLHGYMRAFLKKFQSGYEGRHLENSLLNLYFNEAIDTCGNFLSDYFTFKRSIKNIITGLNSRKFGYPLQENLLGSHPMIESILKSNSVDLGLGKSFPFIEDLSKTVDEGNFTELEKKIDSIYIRYLDAHTPLSPFSEDAIFLYFIKLMIGSRWVPLNEDLGKEELNRNLDWVVNSANIIDVEIRSNTK